MITKLKNINKIAHHMATWRPRAPKVHPRAPKGGQNEACDHWGHDLGVYFAAGGPQGRPRARGVYLINQVIKE